MLGIRLGERVWRRHRKSRRSPDGQTAKIAWELLRLVAILGGLWRRRVCISQRLGRIARKGDEGGVEGAGDVFQGHLHGCNVGSIGFCGPSEDMATNAAGRSVKHPCARVAGGCEATRLAS